MIWKDIIGYEGYYKISSTGQILSLHRIVKSAFGRNRQVPERLLAIRLNRYGYKDVILRKENTDKHFTIHRLVAIHFIENPHNLPSINHKDEDKANNNVNNLEWCSIKHNNLYNGRQDKINAKLRSVLHPTSKVVLQYSIDNVLIEEHKSLHEAYRKTNVDRGVIKRCCEQPLRIGGGFLWSFK